MVSLGLAPKEMTEGKKMISPVVTDIAPRYNEPERRKGRKTSASPTRHQIKQIGDRIHLAERLT